MYGPSAGTKTATVSGGSSAIHFDKQVAFVTYSEG